jgi:hypothetical protein
MPALQSEIHIEDLRNLPAETGSLRSLLESGAPCIPDPKRNGFYEIESSSVAYYIHVSPISGKVLLLAAWPKASEPSEQNQAA